METYGIMYIGSKDKLTDHILKTIKEKAPEAKSVIDVFTGTTRVAQALRANGYDGISSDLSWASESYAGAFLQNEDNIHLQKYIDELNSIEPEEDWLTNTYCDIDNGSDKRVRVWQRKNGMKADAIRNRIEKYGLEKWEKDTLITSLIFSLSRVDNTVGVQQAYLKDWCKRSYNDLRLILPHCFTGSKWLHITGDALKINYPKADIAYLDPPYTAHPYSTYYHIWDSIARWDKPQVALSTNRRIDRCFSKEEADVNMISGWNSKSTVERSFATLLSRLPVNKFLISYSNESLIDKNKMMKILSEYKNVELFEIEYKKNIMTKIGNGADEKANMKNIEYMFYGEK